MKKLWKDDVWIDISGDTRPIEDMWLDEVVNDVYRDHDPVQRAYELLRVYANDFNGWRVHMDEETRRVRIGYVPSSWY